MWTANIGWSHGQGKNLVKSDQRRKKTGLSSWKEALINCSILW